jgi:hypothetical protein
MSQRLDTPKSSAQGAQGSNRDPIAKGRVWPNLVFNKDTGVEEYVEFRAQCEVWLPPAEAKQVEELIGVPRAERSKARFDEALAIVLRRADDAGAKPEFKDVLRRAFEAQPEYGK